ncbi:hypothetical protein HYPSUDRAFT_862522 [Hypholoma sublateritium FD-334 SS-4]|uniref:Uncharacterized protein n=1 Tax=Hypholoma sublateritium (strain FD-334 SS-4) TaxID=945553 RepID=A0A0D2MUB7_HYPSF|nr:hypothetical protein HYPSUDRAFT_862522 [Hypholoma sublateritium FD-334 SS-4]
MCERGCPSGVRSVRRIWSLRILPPTLLSRLRWRRRGTGNTQSYATALGCARTMWLKARLWRRAVDTPPLSVCIRVCGCAGTPLLPLLAYADPYMVVPPLDHLYRMHHMW